MVESGLSELGNNRISVGHGSAIWKKSRNRSGLIYLFENIFGRVGIGKMSQINFGNIFYTRRLNGRLSRSQIYQYKPFSIILLTGQAGAGGLKPGRPKPGRPQAC